MEVSRRVYIESEVTGEVYLGTVGEICQHSENGYMRCGQFSVAISDLISEMSNDPFEEKIDFTITVRPEDPEEYDVVQS